MKTKLVNYQPLVIFWLGLLTGALLVALLLLNNLWRSQDGAATVLTPTTRSTQLKRTTTVPTTSTTKTSVTQLQDWTSIVDPGAWMPQQ